MCKSGIGRWCLVLFAASCQFFAVPGRAAEVETKLAIPLFLKIVSYDYSFSGDEKPDTLRVYFLYEFSHAESYQQYLDTKEFFRLNNSLLVSGVPVKLIGVQKRDGDSIIRSAPESSYAVIICGTGRGQDFQALSPTLKSRNCHSFALDAEDLAAGVAASIEVREQKTAIVVSLRAAKAEGSQYSARLLNMCTIVDRPR